MTHLPEQPCTIAVGIRSATQHFQGVSDTANLDAELLLADVLQVDRSYLYAHGDEVLSDPQHQQWLDFVTRRATGEPLAYIVGCKDFWDVTLKVNRHVLVPRPETEHLVAIVLALPEQPALRVLEIGTGSGAISCALAKARPGWRFHATDICGNALAVAKENASTLGLTNITFEQADVMQSMPAGAFDVVMSNPPYIDAEDDCLKNSTLRHEPRHALVALDRGYAILRHIISMAMTVLAKDGRLYLEHGAAQGSEVRRLCRCMQYDDISTSRDLAGHGRITRASRMWGVTDDGL